jgi:predicted GNAT superfamily acetyltransferase
VNAREVTVPVRARCRHDNGPADRDEVAEVLARACWPLEDGRGAVTSKLRRARARGGLLGVFQAAGGEGGAFDGEHPELRG